MELKNESIDVTAEEETKEKVEEPTESPAEAVQEWIEKDTVMEGTSEAIVPFNPLEENSEPLTKEELDEINALSPEEAENQRLQKEQFEKDLENSSLYITIEEAMRVMEFKESSIQDFLTSKYFANGEKADWMTQRNEFILYVQRKFMLSTLLVLVDGEYKLLESVSKEIAEKPECMIPPPPMNIRYSLVVNQAIQMWMADVVSGILTYLHANEALYFDAVNALLGEVEVTPRPSTTVDIE